MARKDSKKAGRIREYVRKWDDQNKYNNTHYHEMMNFIKGEQWREDEAKLFETYKKIPLTVNKIKPLANHLIGEQRQNTPNLQILPSDDVDEQTAEIREALVKEISLNSNARVVYQTAFMQAVIGGYGAYRVYTEYEDDDSFNQNIVMAAFKDPTKCYFDIGAETPCKTDGMHSGFRTTMSRKKFRSLYGDSLEKKIGPMTTDITDTDSITSTFSDDQSITVIDHFERKGKIITLYQLSNTKTIRSKEFDALERIDIDGTEVLMYQGEPVTIVQQRELTVYKIKHSKWAGDYELESTDFPSEQLPIIFVDQDSFFDKTGKQICASFFKDARDTQRYINYLRTQSAYLIKISRYDQYMASKQNIKSNDTAQIWRDPAIVQGALLYDESPNGNKPEQLRPPELSQSIQMQYESAANDLQMTTGMYDTQLGEHGNEISGAAIDARTKRGAYNTYIPFDSINRAITCGGSVINEMIPHVYDTERLMHLDLKNTGNTKVSLNKPMDEYTEEKSNDMSKGKYKIRLVAGASFEGQKTENLQSMDMVMSKNPETFNAIADLYVENLPMSNNIEMRNRLRTLVAPEIIEAGKTGQPIPPKPQQPDPIIMLKMQELQFKQQEAQMNVQIKMKDLELKEQKLMMESHSTGVEFSKEIQKIQMQREEMVAKLHEQEQRFNAEMSRINADMHQNHTQNIVKILTHQPNHFKAEKDKKE